MRGQRGVSEGVELADRAAGRLEQLGGLGVAERERPPGSHRDAGMAGDRATSAVSPRGLALPARSGHVEQGVEVEVVGDQPGRSVDDGPRGVALGGRHQAQVPFGDEEVAAAQGVPRRGSPTWARASITSATARAEPVRLRMTLGHAQGVGWVARP